MKHAHRHTHLSWAPGHHSTHGSIKKFFRVRKLTTIMLPPVIEMNHFRWGSSQSHERVPISNETEANHMTLPPFLVRQQPVTWLCPISTETAANRDCVPISAEAVANYTTVAAVSVEMGTIIWLNRRLQLLNEGKKDSNFKLWTMKIPGFQDSTAGFWVCTMFLMAYKLYLWFNDCLGIQWMNEWTYIFYVLCMWIVEHLLDIVQTFQCSPVQMYVCVSYVICAIEPCKYSKNECFQIVQLEI